MCDDEVCIFASKLQNLRSLETLKLRFSHAEQFKIKTLENLEVALQNLLLIKNLFISFRNTLRNDIRQRFEQILEGLTNLKNLETIKIKFREKTQTYPQELIWDKDLKNFKNVKEFTVEVETYRFYYI